MPGLTIHKVASNPSAAPPRHLLGIRLLDPPDKVRASTNVIATGRREGWLTLEGAQVVLRPAGPPGDPDREDPHIFHQGTRVVFHTLDGDVAYKVVHNPDKYADHSEASYPDQVKKFKSDDSTKVTSEIYDAGATRVDWFYDLERES